MGRFPEPSFSTVSAARSASISASSSVQPHFRKWFLIAATAVAILPFDRNHWKLSGMKGTKNAIVNGTRDMVNIILLQLSKARAKSERLINPREKGMWMKMLAGSRCVGDRISIV